MTISVVHGSHVLPANDSAENITISAVTMAETFVYINYALSDNVVDEHSIIATLTSTTNININRVASTGSQAVTVYYTIVSGPELTVQRGTGQFSTVSPLNITITEVDLATAFCLVQGRTDGSNLNGDDFIGAALTSTTNLALYSTDPKSEINFSWQVVEHSACSVQRGTIALVSTDAAEAATVSSYTLDKSWLISHVASDSSGNSAMGEKMVRLSKTDTTHITATREATTTGLTVYYQLISMTDDSVVQEIEVAFGTGDVDVDDTISAVDLAKSIAIATGNWKFASGSSAYAGDDDPGVMTASLVMDSTTNLNSIRGITGSTAATLLVNIVEFLDAAAGVTVTPTTLALTLTAAAPAVLTPVLATPVALALSLTENAPTVSAPVVVTPAALALLTAGQAPTITVGVRVEPTTLAMSLTPAAPTITTPVVETPTTLALTLTLLAPTVSTPVVCTPATLALTLTPQTPAVSTPVVSTPATLALTTSLQAPTVSTPVLANPATQFLTLTAYEPTITASDHQLATPGTASLSLTLQVPTVSTLMEVTPGTLELVLTAFAPAIATPVAVTPATLALVLALYAPSAYPTFVTEYALRRGITSLGDGRQINSLGDQRRIGGRGDGREIRRYG